jgi:hypothetical protein
MIFDRLFEGRLHAKEALIHRTGIIAIECEHPSAPRRE